MRGKSGIDIATRSRRAGRPLRALACLLTVLALLAGSGAPSAGSRAMADEADEDEPLGIDIPFTSRDDDERESDTTADAGSTFALTAYVCTPGEDTDLRDRLLVESSDDPDAFFEDGIERDELRAVCTAPAEALTYTLTGSGSDETESRDLGGEEASTFTWTNLSSTGRIYTLRVDAPESYADPIVICTVASDPPGMLTQYYATEGAIRFYSTDGSDNTCEWFNVDLGDTAAGEGGDDATGTAGVATPVDTPTGIATIAVRAYTCTPDDDSELLDRIAYQGANPTTADPIQGISLDDLRNTCAAPGEEIAFTVTNTQDPSVGEMQVLGGDETGEYATWDMDASMIHSVDADEPEGYGEPIVFCALDDGESSQAPMLDGVLYVALGAGTTYTCDWFDLDPGGSAGGAVEAPGGQTGNRDNTGSTTGAEDGNFTLRAYTCALGDDANLRARFAFQTENWTTVDPVKGIAIDQLRETCEPADGSIPFSVTGGETGDGQDLVVAGEDAASVDLEPLTSYTIAADEPDGYGEPLLFCALDGGESRQSPIIEGDLFLILGENVTDACEWFHIDVGGSPLDEAGSNDADAAPPNEVPITGSDVVTADSAAIEIKSYTCADDGSDLLERIAYQRENWIAIDPFNGVTVFELRDLCEPSADEIPFTVTDQDTSERVEKVVGGAEHDGYVTWEVDPDASNTIDADEPEGYGLPIVFCGFHDTGETAEVLSPVPMDDDTLNVGMDAGTTYTCDWFHVDTGDPDA